MSSIIKTPSVEIQLAHEQEKNRRLQRQLDLERGWLLAQIYNIGNCQKCRFFCICGPQYDCRKTMTRKLDKYIKHELTGGKK